VAYMVLAFLYVFW